MANEERAPRRRRRRPIAPRINTISVTVVFIVLTAVGLLIATKQQENNVERVGELNGMLTDTSGPFVNYLLVGSDTREGVDPNSPDYSGIGDTNDAGGQRSDTMMILHVDNERGTASLMSIPRDLWVDIPGYGKDRINSAFQYGADVLVTTVQQSLGVPLNHYVEVNFTSFKSIVAALGGVDLCFEFPTRDLHVGLNVPEAGCYTLDPIQSLAYARSRYFETYQNGEWVVDGRADLGRIGRQQAFIQAAISKAISQTAANPMRTSELVNAAVASLRVDPGTNLVETADYLKPLAGNGVARYSLPVMPETVDGKDVLVLGAEAPNYLGYFAGVVGPPAE
jgi:LCP family protein required for cell wall assembly